jgi:hypothetical protein
MSLPGYVPAVDEVPESEHPTVGDGAPADLVPYPGMGVSYVANSEQETYAYDKRFYCFVEGRWFRADAAQGPWGPLSMKYVPVALYRVRGHLPPALERRERERQKAARVALVSLNTAAAKK